MRAIFFLSFFVFALIIAVRAPFVAALVFLWVDLLAPQSVGYSFIQSMPLAMISGVASVAFYFLFDKKERVHLGFQWLCMVALTIWVTVTTATIAELPEYAWVKWNWAFKTLLFVCFMPFVFRTRVRLEALLLTLLACVGAVAASLAVKTLAGSAGYGQTRIWGGVNATSLGESSSFALVAAAMIPFIWVLRQDSLFVPLNRKLKWSAIMVIIVFIIAIVGSYARTGLICLAALGAIVIIRSRHRFVTGFLTAVFLLVAVPLMPDAWLARMTTIQAGQQEGSSGTRVAVWKWTLGYVAEHPLGGGFDVYRTNEIEVLTPDPAAPDDPTRIIKMKQRARAFHSNYFEMLGEHGWPGLILFMTINLISLHKSWQLWRNKNAIMPGWLSAYAGANLLSQIMVMTGSLFAGNAFKIFTYFGPVISLILWNIAAQYQSSDEEVAEASIKKPRAKILTGPVAS